MTIDLIPMELGPNYSAIVLNESAAKKQQAQWAELVDAFNDCMELEKFGTTEDIDLQRLHAASEALTTHINEQWSKHEAIRRYLKSYGYEQS